MLSDRCVQVSECVDETRLTEPFKALQLTLSGCTFIIYLFIYFLASRQIVPDPPLVNLGLHTHTHTNTGTHTGTHTDTAILLCD